VIFIIFKSTLERGRERDVEGVRDKETRLRVHPLRLSTCIYIYIHTHIYIAPGRRRERGGFGVARHGRERNSRPIFLIFSPPASRLLAPFARVGARIHFALRVAEGERKKRTSAANRRRPGESGKFRAKLTLEKLPLLAAGQPDRVIRGARGCWRESRRTTGSPFSSQDKNDTGRTS